MQLLLPIHPVHCLQGSNVFSFYYTLILFLTPIYKLNTIAPVGPTTAVADAYTCAEKCTQTQTISSNSSRK